MYASDILFKFPVSFVPDGSAVIMNQLFASTQQDVLMLDVSGKKPPVPLVAEPLRDVGGWVSPDARWLAYVSEMGGSMQVWVRPFGAQGRAVQVSDSGGLLVWWSADSRQILWISAEQRSLWCADVVPGATFSVRPPQKVGSLPAGVINLDATPDRRQFIVLTPENSGPGTVTVVQNWRKALEGK